MKPHAADTATHTHVAVKFNCDNLDAFIRLGCADRLTHISRCKPTGAIEALSYGAALRHINNGHNVYADVTFNGIDCTTDEVSL